MEPNNPTPPAPPPISPQKPLNPYDFLEDKPKSKKPLLQFPSGNSKKQRLFVVLAGVILMIIVGIILSNILSAPSRAAAKELVLAAQQQQELIRVAEIGIKDSHSPDTKNLAINAKLTLQTDQPKLQAIVNKVKKLDAKTLALGKDAATDRTLTTARQTNRFDEVFTDLLKKELIEYQLTLKRVHDNSSNPTNKAVFAEQFKNAGLLVSTIPD